MADRVRMEVPFPAAGEGITLKITNPGTRELEGKFGKKWWTEIIEAFDRYDLDALQKCLDTAAYKDGQKVKVNVMEIEVPLIELFTPMTDALYICTRGKTYAELILEHAKLMEAGRSEGNPPNESSQTNS
jgi:hypothetical protein